MERRIENFSEERFVEKYKELLEQYCKAFIGFPSMYTYLHFIQPFMATADNLCGMHFISNETWKICFDLYSEVIKRIQKEFPEWDIKSLYDD